MGKGGTKFESEAIGVRTGRKKFGLSAKDIKKEMETFQKTGRHPALQGSGGHVLPSLPVRDPNRPHVFLSFASGKVPLGRVLVEIFEPELPVTARTFINRCNPGASNSFKGTRIQSVVENYALHGGQSKNHKGVQQRRNEYLRHVQAGLVSVTLNGDALAITFERALTLDDSHQVIGRLHGDDSTKTLQRLNTIAVGANDEPVHSLRISDCGQTDSQGNYDPLLGSSGRRETAEEAGARAQKEEAEARESVGAALEQGLLEAQMRQPAKAAPAVKRKRLPPSDSDESNASSGTDASDE